MKNRKKGIKLLSLANNDDVPKGGGKKSEYMGDDSGVGSFLFKLEKAHLSC